MATSTQALSGDRAARIVDAMRASVASRGVAGSTFDHVAREAGVSRGLLHYHFATKEKLLAEVVRRDCDIRLGALDAALAPAAGADELVEALVRSLEDIVERDPAFIALVFELFTCARRNAEIAVEMGELMRRIREHVARLLADKEREGAIKLGAEPAAVATVLLSLADGLAMRMLSEPERDFSSTVQAGVKSARALIS
jgi:AcrR family transcriptional regulator